MNLSYRGIPYQPATFDVDMTETNQSGQFLGKPYKFVQTNVTHRQAPRTLRYRGVAYAG